MCVAAAHVRYVRRGTCLVAVASVMAPRQTTLEYLTTTKIGEKGQLTVPKQFRKDLGLGTGAPSAVLRLGDGRVLLPEQ